MEQNIKSAYAKNYDVFVVGGGPAGYVAAIRASQLGAKVGLAEKSVVGGTCLNRGCIPTKNYLKNAEMIGYIKKMSEHGINLKSTDFEIDMKKMLEEKNEVVKTLTTGVAGLLASYGVDIYYNDALIHEGAVVELGDVKVKAEKIILATGSKTVKPDIKGVESKKILTSDEILEIDYVPKSLLIVGAGVIGIEMATVFSAFGSEITIVESENHALSFMDKDIIYEVERQLSEKNIKLITSEKVQSFEEKNEKVITHLSNQGIESELVLISIGRRCELDAIKKLDLITKNGKVVVNKSMRTDKNWLYAVGDVNGQKMLAHAAFAMGEVAAENAVKNTNKPVNFKCVPSCIYTFPEIASIGLTEEQAMSEFDISVGRFQVAFNGRALASKEMKGFIKIIADKKYGEILGAHIVGANATELINEISVIMRNELTVYEVVETVHAHPAYSEIIVEACADALGRAIHLPKK